MCRQPYTWIEKPEEIAMRFYWPIAKVDAAQRMVWGYASTEALDDQGERVARQALAGALDDYMRFANIREMHQNSAVGVAKEAEIDDKGLYLGAKIVDEDAWRKVVEGVYNGFSIGGRVTARDPSDRKLITGLALTEISVVDRPANPEAVFDCWKLAAADHADPRGPVDGQPRLAERKNRAPLGRLAHILVDLEWLHERLATETATEGDALPSSAPERLQALIAELSDFVAALIADCTARRGEHNDPHAADLAAAAVAATLRKAQQRELAPLAAGLAELTDAIVPRLDALQKRVEEIARTPLPPQAAARSFGLVGISKREDGGSAAASGEDVAAALARMTDEERTLTLIKAAHAQPIAPFGGSGGLAGR